VLLNAAELTVPFTVGVALELWSWHSLRRSAHLRCRLEAMSSSAMSLRPGTAGSAAVAAAALAGGTAQSQPQAASEPEPEPEPEPDLGSTSVVLLKPDGEPALVSHVPASSWALVVERPKVPSTQGGQSPARRKRTITLGQKADSSLARAFLWKINSHIVSRQFPPRDLSEHDAQLDTGEPPSFGVRSIRELEQQDLFEHDWLAYIPPYRCVLLCAHRCATSSSGSFVFVEETNRIDVAGTARFEWTMGS
jgi:hypothetical protein